MRISAINGAMIVTFDDGSILSLTRANGGVRLTHSETGTTFVLPFEATISVTLFLWTLFVEKNEAAESFIERRGQKIIDCITGKLGRTGSIYQFNTKP